MQITVKYMLTGIALILFGISASLIMHTNYNFIFWNLYQPVAFFFPIIGIIITIIGFFKKES